MKALKIFFKLVFSAKGILLVSILLSFAASLSSIALLGLSAWFLTAAFLVGSTSFNFFYPSAAVRGLAIGRTIFKYLHRLVSHDATLRILTILRVQVFASLLRINSPQRNNLSNHKILNLIISDVDSLDNFFIQLILPVITGVLIFLTIAAILSFIDPILGVSIAIYLIMMLFILPAIFYPLGKKISRELNQVTELNRQQLLSYFQLQVEYLLFNHQDKKVQQLEELNRIWMDSQAKRNKQLALATGIVQILIGILIAGTLYYTFGMYDLLYNPNKTVIATVVIATFVILGCIEILLPIANIFLQLGQIIESARNLQPMLEDKQAGQVVNNIINTYHNIEDLNDFDYLYPYPVDIQTKLTTTQIEISIEQLSLSFDHIPVLDNINLIINPKQHIAILGMTGSGKTSLINILLGLNNQYKGKIKFNLLNYNGDLITTLDATTQQQREFIISLSQRVHIFNDSLANNLLIANQEVTNQQIEQALDKVGLSYLTKQELGLNILLGMGGRNLSGGEIRRLGVARVLLSNSPIILLDEPTESLDYETEMDILNLLWEISQDKTMIMVTHRINQLDKFDRIYNLDLGKLN